MLLNIPGIPVPIPLPLIVKVLHTIVKLFLPDKNKDEAARRSQKQLANYYRWQNELRDQETKIKATYEKSVNDFLAQFYDPQLEKIDQTLAEIDSSCAEHTRNLRGMEELLLRTGDELVALSTTI